MDKAYLVLSNGMVFEGKRFGAAGSTVGELVFTTGMCGYIETLTDPSYAGQIILQTFPLIGNYGMIETDFEGNCAARGYVVREWCSTPSNFRCQYDLDTYLKKQGICGIYGIDTRYVTRIIRESGVMNAMICSEVPTDMQVLHDYQVKNVVAEVSCKTAQTYPPTTEATCYHVALLDYGAKKNIIRELRKRGCQVTVVPQDTTAEDILALHPDGIMLSNGPGDPEENVFCIEQIQKLLGKVPMFGICLGHQLLALAHGGKTMKLKYGHRGVNQPVREVNGVRTFMTSQNHGYAVVSESLNGLGEISFINANDQTCEGMDYPHEQCFSVQFHPEACGGPKDTGFLFDRFIAMMGGKNHAQG